jgi:hypothetical protein
VDEIRDAGEKSELKSRRGARTHGTTTERNQSHSLERYTEDGHSFIEFADLHRGREVEDEQEISEQSSS